MPEFSVIVPAYNAGQFLHSAVASVKAQSVTDWELIVINDGSSDNSADVLKTYAEEDPRIRFYTQDNRGQFFARRRGIDESKGRYLVFLDSDDALMPDCLKTLGEAFGKLQPDMVLYTGSVFCNGSDSGRVFGYISDKEEFVSPRQLRESLISRNDLNSMCVKAFRRELFFGDDTDYSSLAGTHCGEDKVQLLYPVTKAEKILYIPRSLYRYNRREDSTMHRFETERIGILLADEMFSMLSAFMEKWNMNDRQNTEQLALYRVKNYLSVYFGVRRRCTTLREIREFRKYPWGKYLKQLSEDRRIAKNKLSPKDRVKLYIAGMRL